MRNLLLEKIYPITYSDDPENSNHVKLAKYFLEAGIRFLQIRQGKSQDSFFYHQLLQIKTLCKPLQAQFLVNDRVDMALATGANGVHLGQDDLPVSTARKLLGPQAIIGLSTHNQQQFKAAQSEDINYVAIGPIFPTSTKKNIWDPIGLTALTEIITHSHHPVVAIGGISLEKASDVWKAGADSVAVISDIVTASNPKNRVRQYLSLSHKITS